MGKPDFSRRELLTLATVTMLSPALRLFPSSATELAGRAVWLSSLIALPLMLLYARMICRLMERAGEGEGLQNVLLRLPGRFTGRAFLILTGLWFTLYAGFVLRSGADRLVVTVYPSSAPSGFALATGLVCAFAALGSARTLARVGRMVQPAVLGVLGLIIFFALLRIRGDNLLPVSRDDIIPAAVGAIPAADIVSLGLVWVCFFEGCVPRSPKRQRDSWLWTVFFSLLLGLIVLTIVGSYGAELTDILTAPFFVLVRNLVFFRSVERVEALVVALWLFPDFLLTSAMLLSAQSCLRLGLGYGGSLRGGRLFDLSDGRYLIWLCAAGAILAGVFLAPGRASMKLWSETVIPGANLIYCFILIPAAFLLLRRQNRVSP